MYEQINVGYILFCFSYSNEKLAKYRPFITLMISIRLSKDLRLIDRCRLRFDYIVSVHVNSEDPIICLRNGVFYTLTLVFFMHKKYICPYVAPRLESPNSDFFGCTKTLAVEMGTESK